MPKQYDLSVYGMLNKRKTLMLNSNVKIIKHKVGLLNLLKKLVCIESM
jgi:hypothetical protein